MKTLIACYSATGNTLKVAEAIKASLGADLVRIGEQTSIKDLNDHDAIIVCSPVNSNRAPPDVRDFLGGLGNCEGKKYGVAVTYMFAGDAVVGQIRAGLDKKKASFVGSLAVSQSAVADGSYMEKVKTFAALFT